MSWAQCNPHPPRSRNIGTNRWMPISGSQGRTILFNLGRSRVMGVFAMVWPRFCLFVAIFGTSQIAWTQSPTYGIGRTPSAEEIRKWDIAISPTGKELPAGQGTAKEGVAL